MFRDPILEAFDQRLRHEPAAPIAVSGELRATVGEVDLMARRFGDRLVDLCEGGGPVAFAAANGPGFLSGFLALRRLGVPAILIDHRTPTAEQERIAGGLGATGRLIVRRGWPRDGDDVAVEGLADRQPVVAIDPDIAVVKLTSGSTGAPRGILTPSAALVADEAALTHSMGLSDDERILAAIPMSHSYGLSSVAMPALMRRAVLVVPTSDNPFAPMTSACAHRVTFMPTVPAFLQVLVRMKTPPPAPPSLRLVISAGAPLAPATARRFRELYDRPVHVFYGASECGGITYDRRGTAAEAGTLGSPVDGVDVRLEASGTVSVRSPAVARGGYPQPDAALDGEVFRTRDLGGWRGDELVLSGRLDDLVNIKGKKVDPREVERVLLRHEAVVDAVAMGIDDADGGMRLRALVVLDGEPSMTSGVASLRAWCREHLAAHKQPRSLVVLDEIPRNARGKLDRQAARALLDQPDSAA